MYVYRTGAISYYCSSRCYKNGVLVHRKINKKETAGYTKTAKKKPIASS